MAGDAASTPGQDDPREEEMATHSGILAWRSPWTEDLVGCGPEGLRAGTAGRLSHVQAVERVAHRCPEAWMDSSCWWL